MAVAMLVLMLFAGSASAADTGWIAPTSNAGGSGVTNPTRAYDDNSNYAMFTGNPSDWEWYSYDLSSIPAGSTINGIEVNAKGRLDSSSSSGLRTMAVQLSWDGGSTWTGSDTTSRWTTTISNHILGGSTDDWGHTAWTRNEIVNNLRVNPTWSTSRDARLYYLPVRVYYTPSSSPTYDVTVTPSPTSAGVDAGDNFIYTITVTNNGNTAGNYNLVVSDSNSADFQASVLADSSLAVSAGGNGQTTLTVSANAGVSDGQSDTTTITATSVEDSEYSDSTQVTTTVGAPQGPSKVIVKTNRNVILDDPNYDFSNDNDEWGSDYWDGETTMIRAYALVLDSKGNAVANQAVTFSIPEITGSQSPTSTNSDGIASFSYQLNDASGTGSKTPGSYTVMAVADSVSNSMTFTYSYFGCSRCHDDKGVDGNSNPKSPYITTYNMFHTSTNAHHGDDGQTEVEENRCNFCHTSYGTGDGNTANPETFGVHSTSQNCVDCHDDGNGLWDNAADIKDCDSCHPNTNDKVTNFASASFWSSGMIQFSSLPMVAHQGTPTIPCVICHGPMHDTTTPDGIKSLDLDTEESECLACHTSKGKHSQSNPIVCTACHSQDVHAIGVLNKATGNSFVNVGSTNAMTADTADCVQCHSDNTEDAYFGGLTGMSGYNYTNNYDPFGTYDAIHSSADCGSSCHDTANFHSIGEGGGGPDCLFCHDSSGSAIHLIDENAIDTGIHANLNRSSDPNSICWACHQSDGSKPVGASMGDIFNDPYKCTDCHASSGQKSGAYGAFIVDEHYPSGDDIKVLTGDDLAACITCHNKPEMKVAYTSPDGIFTDYSLISHYGKERTDMQIGSDTDCFYCHDGTSEFDGVFLNSANIQITHNNGQLCTNCHNSAGTTSGRIHDASLIGGGGSDCISCHDIGGGAVHLVDATVIASGIHAKLNNVTGDPNEICWGCHQTNGTKPTGMGDRYNTPYICTDCHLESSPDAGLYDAPIVAEHFKSGLDIFALTSAADNVSSCLGCHQGVSEMILPNSDAENGTFDTDGNGIYGGSTNPYHYGKIRTDMVVGTETNCSYCHQSTSEFNGVFQDPGNIDITHNNGQLCTGCHNSAEATSGRIHDASLIGGGGSDCISCHDIGGGAVHLVDATVIASGIHSQLNNVTGDPNEICWGCHQTGGTEPTGMGDIYNSPYICTDCHLESSPDAGLYDAPIVAEHFKNGQDILALTSAADNVSSCLGCHQDVSEMILPNIDAEDGTFDTDGNGIYGGSTNPYHYGKIRADMVVGTETNCSYCHQSTSEFDGVFLDIGNIDITHNGDKSCFTCHRDEASVDGRIHDSSLIGGGGGACIECHSVGGSATVIDGGDLGGHININTTIGGNNNLTSEDCMGCHFDNSHSGPDATNTYYCADCHTSMVTSSPVKSIIQFTDKLHGENTCADCHVADGTYHQNDPRGSVANLTYVNRDGTGSTIVTDCADCHYASNLDDAPFNAPAGGSHILDNDGACSGSCHTNGQPTMIQTVHDVGVGPDWGDEMPFITVPVLNTASVSPGTDVTVTAIVTTVGQFHYVDGAQYRIMEGVSEVIPWTLMMAVDGDFEGANEDVTTILNTSSLPLGTYTVEVRGMAGGPAQNPIARYYPMNGDVSLTKSATLTVQQPTGYISGTVTNGEGTSLSGVLISTTGATDITGPDGTYSLMVPAGNYIVTASKMPEYYDYTTVSGVDVVSTGEVTLDFNMVIKPTGSISGNVTNKIG